MTGQRPRDPLCAAGNPRPAGTSPDPGPAVSAGVTLPPFDPDTLEREAAAHLTTARHFAEAAVSLYAAALAHNTTPDARELVIALNREADEKLLHALEMIERANAKRALSERCRA